MPARRIRDSALPLIQEVHSRALPWARQGLYRLGQQELPRIDPSLQGGGDLPCFRVTGDGRSGDLFGVRAYCARLQLAVADLAQARRDTVGVIVPVVDHLRKEFLIAAGGEVG